MRRTPFGRIEEEHEGELTSSSEDELIPAPIPGNLRTQASSNLYDAELTQGPKSPVDDEDGDDALLNEEDDDDIGTSFDVSGGDKESAIRDRIAQSQSQMKHLLNLFTEDQLRRYETFRRIKFQRPTIKKFMSRVLDQPVNQNSMTVVSGIAKVYVGELVEEARRVMEEVGEMGPIQPAHMLEAQRRLKASGLSATSSLYKRPRSRLFF